MKRIFLLLIVAGLTSSAIHAQMPADTLTMDRAVRLALENNQTIKIADLEKQKAILQEKEYKSKLLPKVEGYSTFSYYYAIPRMVIPGEIFGQTGNIPVEFGTKYDWNSGFRFSQLIYNQSYFTSLELVANMISLQQLSLQQQKEEIALQVSILYCLCQTIDRQRAAFDTTLANMRKLKDLIVLQSENGMARKADIERVAIDIRNLEVEKQQLEEQYIRQINLLKLLTGWNTKNRIYLAESVSKHFRQQLITESTGIRRTELRLLDQKMEAAKLWAEMERQASLPSLTVFGQHYYQGMRDEFDFFDDGDDRFFRSGIIGLEISIPIFEGFARKNRVKIKQVEIQQIQAQREQTEMLCASEQTEAWESYQNSLNALEKQSRNLTSAKKIYRTNLLGYRQQTVNLTDLILSENQLTETRINYHGTLFEAIKARLTLQKINGRLLNQF